MDISQDELEFKWLAAAESYEASILFSKDRGTPLAESWQKIGFCYSLASKQAREQEDFKKIRQQAVHAYQKAAKLFGENSDPKSKGESSKCYSLAEYKQSWIASNPQEKDAHLQKCYNFGKEAITFFNKAKDEKNSGITFNILAQCLFDRIYLSLVESEKKEFVQEGIEFSNDAISIFEKLEIKEDLVVALFLATLHYWYLANIGENEAIRKDSSEKCLEYSEKTLKLSQELNNPYVIAKSYWARTLATSFFTDDLKSSLNYAKQMLEQASTVRDTYIQGIAYYFLAFITDLMIPSE
ncbi:hypothetical protein E2P30_02025, partial [Candidatus Bathyarchaeota archaeon]